MTALVIIVVKMMTVRGGPWSDVVVSASFLQADTCCGFSKTAKARVFAADSCRSSSLPSYYYCSSENYDILAFETST